MSLNSVSMVNKCTPPCCRASYVCYVKQIRRSKYIDQQISIIRFRTQNTNTSTTTNYTNVAYDLLPYNMEPATLTINTCSSSNCRHCHLMYIILKI